MSLSAPSDAVAEWYRWVDAEAHPVILDGGLGELLLKRGNDLSAGCLWSGRLLVTNPGEVSELATQDTYGSTQTFSI